MPNRYELQDKGRGRHRGEHGESVGPGASDKGKSRLIRLNKRDEAIARNSKTPHKRTRRHREHCFMAHN